MKMISNNITALDQQMAISSLEYFSILSDQLKEEEEKGIKIKIGETDDFITIPAKAISLLSSIISMMSSGKSVTLVPTDSELSPQQAAKILKVSRPHFIKILDRGLIPFRKVGAHRRVLLKDVIDYSIKENEEREKQLRFLAKQAQELNLGYE